MWDYTLPWYHGSPYQIEMLLPGSTVTQDESLARVFSHKPQIVSLEDDPVLFARGIPRLRHNGTLPGMLYIVDEPVDPQDVYPHPRTTMTPGLEWLTRRSLRLRLLGAVEISPEEFLTPQDVEDLLSRMK